MAHVKTKRDLVIASVSQLAYKGLGFAVLALLARQLSQDDFAAHALWSQLRNVLHKMLVSATAIGGLVVLGVAILAGPIVKIVYTSAYIESAEILRVLSYAVPGLFLTLVGCLAATAMHRENELLLR